MKLIYLLIITASISRCANMKKCEGNYSLNLPYKCNQPSSSVNSIKKLSRYRMLGPS